MEIFDKANKKLGFGLMRLPLTNENDESSVDIEKFKKMVDIFMERGFTYFDTAIMYCGSKSQNFMKEVLVDRYPRDSYTVATKLHYAFFTDEADREKVFADQLKNCGVDYFDYYLLHDTNGESIEKYEKYDCFGWMLEKKKQGLIRHIGFSFHDHADLLDEILTKHPEVEFVQLQLNYLDWKSETVQSEKCYNVCCKHNKPVVVMEPVRGGTLAKVPVKAWQFLNKHKKGASPASWALRFAGSLDNVKVVLSGMSDIAQMLDNTETFADFKPFSEEDYDTVNRVTDIIKSSLVITCTSCGYCLGGCPQNIAISKYFALYNTEQAERRISDDWHTQQMYFDRFAANFGKPSECIECRQCEFVCTQHLPIVDYLKLVADCFEK